VRGADGLIERAERAGPDDFVTDPLSPDTDRDGLGDAREVAGYTVQLRGGGSVTVKTNPANFDTDGDTAPDGLEARLGGDPTDPGDRDLFADDDGDGLANVVETDGWFITVYAASTTAREQGQATKVRVFSDPTKADTDGDGLLDGQEYGSVDPTFPDRRTGTNPAMTDTDGDGLTDAQEVRGVEVRKLGILVLNPNDADTDNDKLSDGAEAALVDVEADRWVVRVAGKDPYQVWSDPRFADEDFDGLVDGDEWARGSDPTKGDTDGDGRDDAREFALQTDPLRPDFRVSVMFTSIYIQHDADENQGKGEFTFELGVRKPDRGNALGLAAFEPVVTDRLLDAYHPDGDGYDDGGYDIGSGETYRFADHIPQALLSTSFGLTQEDWFTLEAVVREVDVAGAEGHVNGRTVFVSLGGLTGLKVDFGGAPQQGLFLGSKLTAGVTEFTMAWKDGDTLGQVNDDNEIQGEVRGYIIVN
jgi:hypothetical protein